MLLRTRRVLPLALCSVLSLFLLTGLVGTLWLQRRAQAGLPGALPPLNPQMAVPQRGVNAELEQYSAQELEQTLAQIRETTEDAHSSLRGIHDTLDRILEHVRTPPS